jgi:predicted metal-dependent hydrolase
MARADTEMANIGGIDVEVNRRSIKNIHLSVLPPNGRVRLSVPSKTSEQAIRLAIVNKLAWIKTAGRLCQATSSICKRNGKWGMPLSVGTKT